MTDHSEDWEQYLEIREDDIPLSAEILARFHTHLRKIPGEEDISSGDWNQGKYGDAQLLYEGYPIEERSREYRNHLEEVRDGEGFVYPETAGLYLLLGTELDEVTEVRDTLTTIESSGTTARNLRELGKLTEEALERKIS